MIIPKKKAGFAAFTHTESNVPATSLHLRQVLLCLDYMYFKWSQNSGNQDCNSTKAICVWFAGNADINVKTKQ